MLDKEVEFHLAVPGNCLPASRLQQHVEAISQPPKARQTFVVEMLDTVLAQHPS